MTAFTLGLTLVALVVAAAALWFAVNANAAAISVSRALAHHRAAHAEGAEERRVTRHRPAPPLPDGEPPTEALPVQDAPTAARPAVSLPRPGRIGDTR